MGAMAETPENKLIEAFKKVDVYGDIPPPHVQDPMTMVLRQNAIQVDLIRWDDRRARFVLTGTGRNRITARSRSSGKSCASGCVTRTAAGLHYGRPDFCASRPIPRASRLGKGT